MNVGDWVTPSARGTSFHDGKFGVIIERKWCTFSAEWSYTIMWGNADIEKQWVRRGLKYARDKEGL